MFKPYFLDLLIRHLPYINPFYTEYKEIRTVSMFLTDATTTTS
jgi:hypothetical protein